MAFLLHCTSCKLARCRLSETSFCSTRQSYSLEFSSVEVSRQCCLFFVSVFGGNVDGNGQSFKHNNERTRFQMREENVKSSQALETGPATLQPAGLLFEIRPRARKTARAIQRHRSETETATANQQQPAPIRPTGNHERID